MWAYYFNQNGNRPTSVGLVTSIIEQNIMSSNFHNGTEKVSRDRYPVDAPCAGYCLHRDPASRILLK
jgi:hypothetical protein